MRVLISVDMEGISGVVARSDTMAGTPSYERFRRRMTEETNAAIRGVFKGGATSVVVNDSHGSMKNLLYEEIDERAELISGSGKVLCMVAGGPGSQAACFVGYHAWAGTAHAVLDHTISSKHTANWWLNGERVGEAQINAALLGFYGVPVVLVTGDQALAQQVASTLPQARRVVVKESIDRQTARSLPPGEVLRLIESEAETAVRAAAAIEPLRREGPQTFRIEFTLTSYAEAACLWPDVVRIDDRTVEIAGQDMLDAWRRAYATLQLASSGDE